MYYVNDKRTLEDITLCAFRYAKTRHTYVLSEVIDFIKDHKELVTNRVKSVLLKDTNDQIAIYDAQENLAFADIDYKTLIIFKNWLEMLDIKD